MNFDKEIFKSCYGYSYIRRIKISIFVCLIALGILLSCIALGLTLPYVVGIIVGFCIAIPIFPLIPLLLCYYVQALQVSKRQKQWFEDGELHVKMVPKAGFDWGAVTVHEKEFIVNSISNITTSTQYIIIHGDIELTDTYNGMITKKRVGSCKIPRCFSNEDKVLNLEVR